MVPKTARFETKLSRQLADNRSHYADLRTASYGLDALDVVSQIGHEARAYGSATDALWTGIITAYCRCFGHGRTNRLDAVKIFIGTNGGYEYHQHIYSLRQTHFAHDSSVLRQSQTTINVSENAELSDLSVVLINADLDKDMRHQMKELVEHVIIYTDREYDTLYADAAEEAQRLSVQERHDLRSFEYEVPSTRDGKFATRKQTPRAT